MTLRYFLRRRARYTRPVHLLGCSPPPAGPPFHYVAVPEAREPVAPLEGIPDARTRSSHLIVLDGGARD